MANYDDHREAYAKHSGSKSNISEFVFRANTIHGSRYDYSLSLYKNSKTPLLINCYIHGVFKQSPDKHLGGSGCHSCAKLGQVVKRTSSNGDFIQKALNKHGNRYDYSKTNYRKANNKVTVICRNHGDFLVTPNKHLQGRNCPLCAKTKRNRSSKKNTGVFIFEATKKHGDKYDYSKSSYNSALEKITITCRVHGDFRQVAASHLQGFGCAKCGYDLTAWNKSAYTACSKKNGKSCIYLIKCFNDTESFYKIGITSTAISYRFKKSKMPYCYDVLSTITNGAEKDWDDEKILHRLQKEFKYSPAISFGGETECFSELTQEVKNFFGV